MINTNQPSGIAGNNIETNNTASITEDEKRKEKMAEYLRVNIQKIMRYAIEEVTDTAGRHNVFLISEVSNMMSVPKDVVVDVVASHSLMSYDDYDNPYLELAQFMSTCMLLLPLDLTDYELDRVLSRLS